MRPSLFLCLPLHSPLFFPFFFYHTDCWCAVFYTRDERMRTKRRRDAGNADGVGVEHLTYFVRKTDRSGTIAAYEKGLVVGVSTGAPLLLTWRLVSAIVVTSPQLTRIQTTVQTAGEIIDQRHASFVTSSSFVLLSSSSLLVFFFSFFQKLITSHFT